MSNTITLSDEAESTVSAVSELVFQLGGQVTGGSGNTLTVEPRIKFTEGLSSIPPEERNAQAAYDLVRAVEQSPLVVSEAEQAERKAQAEAESARADAERQAQADAQADADAAADAEAARLADAISNRVATKVATEVAKQLAEQQS